ncbi:hypothetical protein EVA_16521 [gut metagenome]|uniref:Uncharacterized protein n=1 Tax=gut metagenome TaxID=749906 RepID=J9FKD3_9ZZZZ
MPHEWHDGLTPQFLLPLPLKWESPALPEPPPFRLPKQSLRFLEVHPSYSALLPWEIPILKAAW